MLVRKGQRLKQKNMSRHGSVYMNTWLHWVGDVFFLQAALCLIRDFLCVVTDICVSVCVCVRSEGDLWLIPLVFKKKDPISQEEELMRVFRTRGWRTKGKGMCAGVKTTETTTRRKREEKPWQVSWQYAVCRGSVEMLPVTHPTWSHLMYRGREVWVS